jgi:hypothetical protein
MSRARYFDRPMILLWIAVAALDIGILVLGFL